MTLKGSRFTPWLPSTPLDQGQGANRKVASAIVACLPFPIFLLVGAIWLSKPPVDPPIYTSPPTNQVLIATGYPQPNLTGLCILTKAIQDTDNTSVSKPVLTRGYPAPHLRGAVSPLRAVMDQGNSAPNVAAYSPRVVKGYSSPHLQGKVWKTTWSPAVPDIKRPGVPFLFVPGWQPTGQGFVCNPGRFAQIDHDLQADQLRSMPKVVSWKPTGSTYYPGFIWQTNLGGRQSPPSNQLKLSAPAVIVSARVNLYGAGSVWASKLPRFNDNNRSMPHPAVVSSYPKIPAVGKVWLPFVRGRTDGSKPMQVVGGWQPIGRGFVWMARAVNSVNRRSPVQVFNPIQKIPAPGSVWLADAALNNPKPPRAVSGVIRLSFLAPNQFPGTGGRVWLGTRAIIYGVPQTYLVDFKWTESSLGTGWNIILSASWSLSLTRGWNIGDPQE